MPEVRGVSRDLTQDMKEWVPIQQSLEAEDEEMSDKALESSNVKEVGGKLRKIKKEGKYGYKQTSYESVPGEVKKRSGEAVSKEMTPEEALEAAQEAAKKGEILSDNVQEVVGPNDDVDEDFDEHFEKIENLKPLPKAGSTATPVVTDKRISFFENLLSKIGMGKSVNDYQEKSRKMKEHGTGKPKYKEQRQQDSLQ